MKPPIKVNFQKLLEKSKTSSEASSSLSPKENQDLKIAYITKNVDNMVSATENILDAALEEFNEWYYDIICRKGSPNRGHDKLFELIENGTQQNLSDATIPLFPKNDNNGQEKDDRKTGGGRRRIERCSLFKYGSSVHGFSRLHRLLSFILLSASLCVDPNVCTTYSSNLFMRNHMVFDYSAYRAGGIPNTFAPTKVPSSLPMGGILGVLKDLLSLDALASIGSCLRYEC